MNMTSASSSFPDSAREIPRFSQALPILGLICVALAYISLSPFESPEAASFTPRLKQSSESSAFSDRLFRYDAIDSSSLPCSLRMTPSVNSASLSRSSSSSRTRRILASAPSKSFRVMRISAQSLRHVAHRGLIASAHSKCSAAPSRSFLLRRSEPRFLRRRTCSTLSSIKRNAPRMNLVPSVTRWPPCRTEPGRNVPCPTSMGRTSSLPKCS
mmetsp:Transcript_15797/g.36393  ORF Transcript_15797/g.36393 Transcript_15797/m.36393 type:complete len:213 (-) Transcript_15797:1034-1672(-)